MMIHDRDDTRVVLLSRLLLHFSVFTMIIHVGLPRASAA